jgi:hypothetical protein
VCVCVNVSLCICVFVYLFVNICVRKTAGYLGRREGQRPKSSFDALGLGHWLLHRLQEEPSVLQEGSIGLRLNMEGAALINPHVC